MSAPITPLLGQDWCGARRLGLGKGECPNIATELRHISAERLAEDEGFDIGLCYFHATEWDLAVKP